jgi:DNA invertase Pin-like site-specific DNA recombinase
MKKKVLELIRTSTATQAADDRGGIPAQRAANRRTAQVYGLEIVRSFEIADVSGAKILSAPEFQELLSLIESPDIVGVVAREFSRLMRPEDLSDFAILQKFIETKTSLFLPDGEIDLRSKSGKLFGVLRAAMAGFEREEIRERMESGKEAIRRAGRHAGGSNSLPYGVNWTQHDGWVYAPEAEKVKEAFRQVLTTSRPYAEIAAELGMPRNNLRCVLQNPIWTGWKVYDMRRDRTAAGYVARENGRQGYRRKIQRDPLDVIRVKVLPGIISEADFQRVQAILADRAARERQVRTAHAPLYQFNGFLACSLCGNPLYTHTSQDRYYICKLNGARARAKGQGCRNPYILASKVEPKVVEVFSRRIQSKNAIAQIAEMYVAGLQQPSGVAGVDAEASKALLAALQAKRERVMDAFFDGSISKPERDKRLKAIDSELSRISAMIETAIPQSATQISTKNLARVLQVFSGFRFLNRDQKRELLQAARARVFMNGYTIDRLEIAPPFTPVDGHTGSPFPAAGASLPVRCGETPAVRQEKARRCAKAKLHRDGESFRRQSARRRKSCDAARETDAHSPAPPLHPVRQPRCGSWSFPAPLQT